MLQQTAKTLQNCAEIGSTLQWRKTDVIGFQTFSIRNCSFAVISKNTAHCNSIASISAKSFNLINLRF